MNSVIDLIDNVIDEVGDAMRWSPNAPDPTPPEPDHRIAEFVEAMGLALTEWQKATLAGISQISVAFGEFAIVVREAGHLVRMSKIRLEPVEVARQARLRRMRHLYRQRRR